MINLLVRLISVLLILSLIVLDAIYNLANLIKDDQPGKADSCIDAACRLIPFQLKHGITLGSNLNSLNRPFQRLSDSP